MTAGDWIVGSILVMAMVYLGVRAIRSIRAYKQDQAACSGCAISKAPPADSKR
jgi:hypothetical protein